MSLNRKIGGLVMDINRSKKDLFEHILQFRCKCGYLFAPNYSISPGSGEKIRVMNHNSLLDRGYPDGSRLYFTCIKCFRVFGLQFSALRDEMEKL